MDELALDEVTAEQAVDAEISALSAINAHSDWYQVMADSDLPSDSESASGEVDSDAHSEDCDSSECDS